MGIAANKNSNQPESLPKSQAITSLKPKLG